MKRNILIAITVTIVVLLVSPALIGARIEGGTIKDLIALVPEESGMVLTETDYQGGWFSSSARLEVGYPALSELIDTSVKLILDLKIKHGPLISTEHGLHIGMVYADIVPRLEGIDLDELMGGLPFESPEFSFSALVKFSQSVQLSMEMGNIDIDDNDMTFTLQGLTASVEVDSRGGNSTALEVGELHIAVPRADFQLSISGLSLSTNTEDMAATISPTTASLLIPQITSIAPYALEVNGIGIHSGVKHSHPEPGKFDIHQSMEVQEVFMEFPFKSARLVFEINNLSAELASVTKDFLSSMQEQLSRSDQSELNYQFDQLSDDLAALMLHESMQYKMLLEANVYGGDHSLALDVSWSGLPGVQEFNDVDVQQALQALDIQLTLKADEAALRESPLGSELSDYEDANYLVAQNGTISISATLVDGKLTVNGDVIPIDEMISQ